MVKCFNMSDFRDDEDEHDDISIQEEKIVDREEDEGVIDEDDDENSVPNRGSDYSSDSDEEILGQGDDKSDVDNSEEDEMLHPQLSDHMGCISQTLQLAINDALKTDADAKSFIQAVQSVMVFFKKSIRWSDELKIETNVDVVLPAATRWNATLDMIKRYKDILIILVYS